MIELNTPVVSIKITGKNLQKIFDFLGEHHIKMIKEPEIEEIKVSGNNS